MMRVVCSFCGEDMGEKEPLQDNRLSHGMCTPCFEHFSKQWNGLKLGEYLDDFEVPVVVFDRDVRVQAANKPMADLLGKSEREMSGLLGGEVMECVYARRPEGCGGTIHCKTCTIRNTVERTLDTGEPQTQLAYLNQDDRRVQLFLSTTVLNGAVGVVVKKIASGKTET